MDTVVNDDHIVMTDVIAIAHKKARHTNTHTPKVLKSIKVKISSDLSKPCCDLANTCLLLGKFSVL